MKDFKKTILILSLVAVPLSGCGSRPAEQQQPASPLTREPAGTALTALFGENVINASGEKVDLKTVEGKIIGVYFSAHWCPPCQVFTPILVETYNELKKQNKPFEIIFVSSDRDRNAMFGYMREYKMPWLAVEYSTPVAQELAKKYSVRGIPYLVIIDPQGKTISTNARIEVTQKRAGAFEIWSK